LVLREGHVDLRTEFVAMTFQFKSTNGLLSLLAFGLGILSILIKQFEEIFFLLLKRIKLRVVALI
jgi:hypothetical protein